MKKLGIKLAILLFLIILKTLTANSTTVEWYDTGVGDKNKTVLEVKCKGKVKRLVLNKDEIDRNEVNIIKWFDEIKSKCEGEN
jgi:hypothetical protein